MPENIDKLNDEDISDKVLLRTWIFACIFNNIKAEIG